MSVVQFCNSKNHLLHPRAFGDGRYLLPVRSSSVQLTEVNAAKSSEISQDCGIESKRLACSGKHQKIILHILMHSFLFSQLSWTQITRCHQLAVQQQVASDIYTMFVPVSIYVESTALA